MTTVPAQRSPLPFNITQAIPFEEGWKYLEDNLLAPLQERLLSIDDYQSNILAFRGRELTGFYSIVYQMRIQPRNMFPTRQIYTRLQSYLETIYKTQSSLVHNKDGLELVHAILVIWKRHKVLTTTIHTVFHYIDRFQSDDVSKIPLQSLALSYFESHVFNIVQNQLSDAILNIFDDIRTAFGLCDDLALSQQPLVVTDILNLSALSPSNPTTTTTTTTTTTSTSISSQSKEALLQLVKSLSDLLIELDPVNLRVYRTFLESRLIASTSEHYQQLGTSCLLHIISRLNTNNPSITSPTTTTTSTTTSSSSSHQSQDQLIGDHMQHLDKELAEVSPKGLDVNENDPSEFLWRYVSQIESILRIERDILRQTLHKTTEPTYISAIHEALIFKTPLLSCNLHSHISVVLMSVCGEELLSHPLTQLSGMLIQRAGGKQTPSFPLFQRSLASPTSPQSTTTTTSSSTTTSSISPPKRASSLSHFISLVRLFSVVPNTLSIIAESIRQTIHSLVRTLTRSCFITGYDITKEGVSSYHIELQRLLLSTSQPFVTILLGIPLRLALTQVNPSREMHIKKHCLIPALLLLSPTLLDIFQEFTTASIILKRAHEVALRDHLSKMSRYIYDISQDIVSSSQQQVVIPRNIPKTICAELLATHFDLVLKAMGTTHNPALPLTHQQWVEHLTGATKFLKLVSDKDVVVTKYRDLLCKRVFTLGKIDSKYESILIELMAPHIGRSKLEIFSHTLADVEQCEANTLAFEQWLHNTFPLPSPLSQFPSIMHTQSTTMGIPLLDKRFPLNGTIPCSTYGVKMNILLISTLSWPKQDTTTGTLVLPYSTFESLMSYTPISGKGTLSTTTHGKPKGRNAGVAVATQKKANQLTSIRYPSVPFPLNECVRAYSTYYHSKHTFRKLSWVITNGTVVMAYRLPNGSRKVDVKCSTIQASILLLFNNVNTDSDISTRSITLSDASHILYIPVDILVHHLSPLIVPNGLLVKNPPSLQSCQDTDVLLINIKFNPPPQIPIVQIPPHLGMIGTGGGFHDTQTAPGMTSQSSTVSSPPQSTTSASSHDHNGSVVNEFGANNSNAIDGFQQRILYKREVVVKAKIVRIMKQSPPTHYKGLFGKCKQAIIQFDLTEELFKVCLQELLDYEYISRTDDPMVFKYNP